MKKIAIVTGGAGGIGRAICEELMRQGMHVIATLIPAEQESAQTWAQTHSELELVTCDVTDAAVCEKTFAEIETRLGRVDVLVNCAGITRDGVFKKMELAQWRAVLETNLFSVYNTTRPLIEGMLARGYGRIINISSVNGQKGQFGQTNYSAAKAGVHGFTMALAQETASKGITVNTVSPGYIGTQMVMAIEESVRNKLITQIPVGRLGKPEEIARVVAFLAHEDNGFITGANIDINGGMWMH